MKVSVWIIGLSCLLLFSSGQPLLAQADGAWQGQNPGEAQGAHRGEHGPQVFGKITVIHGSSSMEITKQDGTTVTVNLTSKTQFHKGREEAKLGDFQVGDVVSVHGQENPDHSWTAERVGTGFMNSGGAHNGGGAMMQAQGTLGKDYVSGEVKGVDPPNLTIQRSDNVTQTITLNEDTSLHKGHAAATMQDIKVGDHVFASGSLDKDVFVPKNVTVMDPAQWQRMQERRENRGQAPANGSAAAQPQTQNNTEPQT